MQERLNTDAVRLGHHRHGCQPSARGSPDGTEAKPKSDRAFSIFGTGLTRESRCGLLAAPEEDFRRREQGCASQGEETSMRQCIGASPRRRVSASRHMTCK